MKMCERDDCNIIHDVDSSRCYPDSINKAPAIEASPWARLLEAAQTLSTAYPENVGDDIQAGWRGMVVALRSAITACEGVSAPPAAGKTAPELVKEYGGYVNFTPLPPKLVDALRGYDEFLDGTMSGDRPSLTDSQRRLGLRDRKWLDKPAWDSDYD